MTYQDFLDANRNKLLGYLMLAEVSTDPDALETPYPPTKLSEEALGELRDRLNECMPLDSMITDLWDRDIHFEEYLGDDWYFEAVFGAASSIVQCAEELAEFFVEKCDEWGIDYDQSPDDDPEFEGLVRQEAQDFIRGWRNNVFARHAQPGAATDAAPGLNI
jgi:hypothetical protein